MNTALAIIVSGWIGQFPVYEYCPPVIVCPPVVETIPPAPEIRWRFHMKKSDVFEATKIDIITPHGEVYQDVWVLNGYLPQITTEKDKWGRPKVRHFWYGAKRKHNGKKVVRYYHAKEQSIVRDYPKPDSFAPAPSRDTSSRKAPPVERDLPPLPPEHRPAPALILPSEEQVPSEDDSHLFRDLDE